MYRPRLFFIYWGGNGLIFLLLLLTVPAAYGQDLPGPGAIIAEILPIHPSVRRAEALVLAAEELVKGSRVQPNPTLTIAATAGDAGESSNILSQPLEISGQPRLRQQKAKAQLEQARLMLIQARREVAAAVCRDWLRLWENYHQLLLARVRLSLVSEMVKAAQRRYEVGEIPRNESLRAELARAEAQADFEKTRAEFLSAKRVLVLLQKFCLGDESVSGMENLDVLGLPDSEVDSAADSLVDLDLIFARPALMEEAPQWSLEDSIKAAGVHPEIEAKRQQIVAGSMQAELTGKERAPMLGISFYRSRFIGNAIEQGAQLTLSFPIFDWGSISSKQRAEQYEVKAQQAALEESTLKLLSQVTELWTQWQAAKSIREILEGQARRYEELARKSKLGYDLGLLSLTDVLQTETAFRQAGVQLIEAHVQVSQLQLQLLESTDLAWPKALLEE